MATEGPAASPNERKSLLAVFPLAPWPAREHGISIRYYPILRFLSSSYDIDLVVLNDYRANVPDDPLLHLLRHAEVHYVDKLPTVSLLHKFRVNAEIWSPSGVPYLYASYRSEDVYKIVSERTRSHQYDTLLWVSAGHTAALNKIQAELPGTRMVLDFVDSPLLHYQRASQTSGAPALLRPFDLWKTKNWERSLQHQLDATAYISPIDADAVVEHGRSASKVIPNAVFTDDYCPPAATEESQAYLGYLGNMGYEPNVQAALRLHNEIYQPLKKQTPAIKLMIIGRSPDRRILSLANEDVIVTGTVENIWEHIYRVAVFVFPMSSGAGLQNKVLEAMYAGKPVVTTDICNASVGACSGTQIFAGHSNSELRTYTKMLLEQRGLASSMGIAGQTYIKKKFALSNVTAAYEDLLFPCTALPSSQISR